MQVRHFVGECEIASLGRTTVRQPAILERLGSAPDRCRGGAARKARDVQALVRSLSRPLPKTTALFPMLWYATYAAIERAAKIRAYSVNV